MEQHDKEKAGPDSTFADWMKSVTDFWLSAAETGTAGTFKAPKNSESPSSDFAGRMQEGWQGAGEHVIRYDASGLAGGVYYYRVAAGRYSATKAMVVLR